ncbi:MAG: HAMP domain-containing histidine kinase [Oligoflexia bacterium]|nr:HAMP domain-containing histidine kinase [Oligoflexia bacterium]
MITLRNNILITIGSLIILTATAIMVVAWRSISYSNTSHAFNILSVNSETSVANVRSRINLLNNIAVTLLYNKKNSMNSPVNILKDKIAFSVAIIDSGDKSILAYSEPENFSFACRIYKSKNYHDNIYFYKPFKNDNTLCINIPLSEKEKGHRAVFNIPLTFLQNARKSLPSLLFSHSGFIIDQSEGRYVKRNDNILFNTVKNIESSKETSSFFTTEDYFFFNKKIGSSNLNVLSYNRKSLLKSSAQMFFLSSTGLMITILFFSIMVFVFLVDSFLKPIKELCVASSSISQGEYHENISESRFKELNELISSFNFMIKNVKDREDDLNSLNKNLEIEVEKKTNELLHTAKMASLGTLSGGMAHEFNNILGAVVGHVSFALENEDPKEMKEALEIALMASERACSIVSRLQDFTKKKEYTKELFNINDSIINIVKLVEKDFINNKINIETDLTLGATILGDIHQVEQVILNLLINSRHAMDNGGRISIKSQIKNDKVIVTISDTGAGIEKEIQDRIFEPFFTTKGAFGMGKSYDHKPTDGTGLGLSVSMGIIETHNGSIRLVSSSSGGTKFEITLPLAYWA